MTRWLSILGLLAAGTAVWAADDNKSAVNKNAPKIQVISLSIHKAPPPKPNSFMASFDGVHMDVMVSVPKRFITGVDVKASKLDRFTDDKDNALYKKGGGLFGGGPEWLSNMGMRFDADGETFTIHIQGNKLPGKGAGKIIFKGSVNVKCGAEEKATDAKELTMKPKEEVDIGPFKLRRNQFGGIEILSSNENIKKIDILDDKGKPIMTSPPTHVRSPLPNEKLPYVYSLFLFGKRDKVSVKVHYFAKVETISVPLDLRVGLSLE